MISVVVPIYISDNKKYAMTEECLRRAKAYSTQDIEWIIVETESDFFKDQADIHIYERLRQGCTISINRGLKVARGEHVVVLTNDVYLEPNWDKYLLDCFVKRSYCGMATLATSQLHHTKHDKIAEGIWCSVYMIRGWLLKELDYLDEEFKNSWDDTDLIMRLYTRGFKMFRNYNCVVKHLVGATHYSDTTHQKNYAKNQKRFLEKHEEHKDTEIYKILTEGWVV